jgi:F-type H+-transporting ATPase subunit delta
MERLSILYASALYDLALKHNAVDDFLKQSIFLRDSLQDEDCQRVLSHPQISATVKHELFREAFEGHIHDDLLGFLYLVADKRREAFLLPALTALIGVIERHNRKVTAKVMSAVSYDEKQSEAMKDMLAKRLDKHVELDLKVDPSIIGGPYIFVDGCHIDWTVKKRLRDLTASMKEQSFS